MAAAGFLACRKKVLHGEEKGAIPLRGIDYRHGESYGWLSGIRVVFFLFLAVLQPLPNGSGVNSLTKRAQDEWTNTDRPGKKSRSFLEMRRMRPHDAAADPTENLPELQERLPV